MSIRELLGMAFTALGGNKLRSALTLLGMVIGVFAIIVSVTAVQVIESAVVAAVQSFGSTKFSVSRSGDLRAEGGHRRARLPLTYTQMVLLADRAQLPVTISPSVAQYGVRFRSGEGVTDPNVFLHGSNEGWMLNNNYDLAQGRFLSPDDVRLARPVAAIGADLAEKLFPQSMAVGKDVVGDRGRLRVVGVLKRKGEAFGQNQDLLAVTPITHLFSLYGRPERDISFDVRAPSEMSMQETIDEVIGHLRVIRGVRPGEENDFSVETNDSLLGGFSSVAAAVQYGGAGIGLLTLFAAGIGIMNIMLVSVTERTREIGVRKSLGARRVDVLKQFLLEAIFLCQLGGFFGIAAGVLVANLLAFAFETSFVFPWLWATVAVVGVTFFGVTFGVYPAWKAARLDPIEALRYE